MSSRISWNFYVFALEFRKNLNFFSFLPYAITDWKLLLHNIALINHRKKDERHHWMIEASSSDSSSNPVSWNVSWDHGTCLDYCVQIFLDETTRKTFQTFTNISHKNGYISHQNGCFQAKCFILHFCWYKNIVLIKSVLSFCSLYKLHIAS